MDPKDEKLAEARHFLGRMRDNQGNQHEFNYDLSAFLASARSVLQYVFKEIKGGDAHAQSWYDGKVAQSPNLRLFRNLRDDNIHELPASTTKHATSAGERTHYFRSKYTQAEVLGLLESYVQEIEKLLNEGIAAGHVRKST
jgi:hypothetical protein